jgi:D-alanine-D-alanine ligase-like ATP-grasp enzyme/ribosomal protein S18 acetylase RimI-like enzyme
MNALPSVLVLYNRPGTADVSAACAESDAGVIDQVNAVTAVLRKLHAPHRTAAIAGLAELPPLLAASVESLVFNLVEALAGDVYDAALVPALCAAFGKGCTGGDTAALLLTLDKVRTKAVLAALGVPVPGGTCVMPGAAVDYDALPPSPLIVKPLYTDGSEGIEEDTAVLRAADAPLEHVVAALHTRFNQPVLIEQYVGTRELQVALCEREHGVDILAVSEVEFEDYAPGKARIVGYRAKWQAGSFEYTHTPRRIPAPLPDNVALRVCDAARTAWHATGCRDYARVDLRLADDQSLWVLEVNCNPDVSPEAGFAAAARAHTLGYDGFVQQVIGNAARRAGVAAPPLAQASVRADVRFDIHPAQACERDGIAALVAGTGFFRPGEIRVACEVLDDALARGPASGYESYAATENGVPVGWICYGPTACTVDTWDVYWIAVASSHQGRGVGSRLLDHATDAVRGRNGRMLVIETSGHPRYDKTRGFYTKHGFVEAARLPDFYAPGDDKVVYVKNGLAD